MNFPTIFNSNFTKYVKSKEIHNLEKKLISNKCVDEKSFYDTLETKIIDGISYKILKKGLNIYRAYNGFFDGDETVNMKDNEFIWYTNKYAGYTFCRNSYVGMCSYKIIEDIYLVDFYNENTLEYLIKNIQDNDIIKHIRVSTGFNISLEEQIKLLEKIYKNKKYILFSDNKNVIIYKNPIKFYGSWIRCNTKKINNLNPIIGYTTIGSNDKKMLKTIKNKNIFNSFEGIIRCAPQSFLDFAGNVQYEEYVINVNSVKNKIIRNYKDPLDWKNWKFNTLKIPKNGLNIWNILQVNFVFNRFINKNINFRIIRYYTENNNIFPEIKSECLFSWSLDEFYNINTKISLEQNLKNILQVIFKYKDVIKYLFLQKVSFKTQEMKNSILNILKKMFKNVFIIENGTLRQIRNIYIIFATNENINYNVIKYKYKDFILNKNMLCNSIIINDGKYKGGYIYLPEKIYDYYDTKIDDKYKRIYYDIRTDILSKIIDKNIDYIIGNFNFTPDDEEINYLKKNNFIMKSSKLPYTTYGKRTDMVFYNKNSNIKFGNDYTIRCNYSDHLPIAIEL
jgi:hypothetical protein